MLPGRAGHMSRTSCQTAQPWRRVRCGDALQKLRYKPNAVVVAPERRSQTGCCERAMVYFIRRWYRFGGGSGHDIFVEFGLIEQQFFGRVLELFDTVPTPHGVTADILGQMRKVC